MKQMIALTEKKCVIDTQVQAFCTISTSSFDMSFWVCTSASIDLYVNTFISFEKHLAPCKDDNTVQSGAEE
jgi:hypothetical protein